MPRVVIIGNAAGGKSTLARHLAGRKGLPLVEIDKLHWQDGWRLTPDETFARRHAELIGCEVWLIEGLGMRNSISERLARATEIILIDLPLWVHFALAAERQIKWREQEQPPAGLTEMPSTRELFRAMWEVDQNWMPAIREFCREAELAGKIVRRLASLEDIDALVQSVGTRARTHKFRSGPLWS